MFMNVYVHGYVYVYDSICWALKCPVHCAEQFLELKICISPQCRAIDPANPAGGFIQQNEIVRFATAACMQKYGNVRFATVACAKCIRYGGRGGGWQHGTRNHISYIYIPYMDPMALAVLVVCDVIDVMMFLFFRRKFQRLWKGLYNNLGLDEMLFRLSYRWEPIYKFTENI